jgi:hypothetical protein
LPNEQKVILVQLCITWLKNPSYTKSLLTESIAEMLINIANLSLQTKNPVLAEMGQTLYKHLTLMPSPNKTVRKMNTPLPVLSSAVSENSFFSQSPHNARPTQLYDTAMVKQYRFDISALAARSFVAIEPWEWSVYNPKNPSTTPNLQKAIDTFNLLSGFVASQILTADTAKEYNRKALEKHYTFFVDIAYLCLKKGDFFSASAIYGALQNTSLLHLIVQKNLECYPLLCDLENTLTPIHNYSQLRTAAAERKEQAFIPSLTLLLHDATFNRELISKQLQAEYLADALLPPEHRLQSLRSYAGLLQDIEQRQNKLHHLSSYPETPLQQQILDTMPLAELEPILRSYEKNLNETLLHSPKTPSSPWYTRIPSPTHRRSQ